MIIDPKKQTSEQILNLASFKNKTVLEIGCGDGHTTMQLVDQATGFIAIDPNSESIAKAKECILGVDFRVGSGENLEFPKDSFDVVLFTQSLHHQNGYQALNEASRVLREGGQVLVVEPAVDGELSILCNIFDDETNVLNTAVKAMDNSKFKIVSREEFDTDWVFENKQEFYNWLFDYYDILYDESKITQVNHILGSKQYFSPLVLVHKLVITNITNH